ncbi:hypothetical protein [Geobacter pickeringii]|uniref:Uncharacterized protein n=1 Tax=Geobacter pickeringii TaxID=345632 RepID=A0A0B5BK67_9BACT|nr:hypothetical protein [Geobacter pickeringii]AJE04456.1 hypothetical protein GPICK_14795 [Geobacter pickeringii]
MVTILLIADQDRLEQLFDFTRESSQIDFRISRSLRQGILDIAEAPPAFLFIQNHLSGLSGEIIARHLVAEIAGKRPVVALFGEDGRCAPVQGVVDACLNVSLADEELVAAIIGLISGGTDSTDSTAESPAPAEPVTAADEAMASPLPAGDGAPSPRPEPNPAEPAAAEPVLPKTETSPFDQTLQSALDDTPAPVALAALEDTMALNHPAEGTVKPEGSANGALHTRGRARTGTLQPYLVAAAVFVAGMALLFLLMPTKVPVPPPKAPATKQSAGAPAKPSPSETPVTAARPVSASPATTATPLPAAPKAAEKRPVPTPKQSEPPAAPKPAAKGLAKLPAFIPRDGFDKKYGAAHPGWERYRGARTEFKVYREESGIKAVQAIDRSGVGIPESFLRGALAQMTESRDFAIAEKEAKGKFLAEKGTVASGARLVIYRTAPRGPIRAFVVYFQ